MTTPGERDRLKPLGIHVSGCQRGTCTGWSGGYDTYICICWCHERKQANAD